MEGDEAGAETYFFAVSRNKREDGAEMCNQLGGRFVDKLRREEGRWLIKHRVVVRDWGISLPIEADWTARPDCWMGKIGRRPFVCGPGACSSRRAREQRVAPRSPKAA